MIEEIITKEDVNIAIKKLKNRKAAGCDDVVGEFIKHGGENLETVVHNLFSEIFETGQIPEDWRLSRVELIHKGGGKEKADIGNYRPISVINIMNKIFGDIVNDKLQKWVEQERVLGEEQNGFRKGRSGLENVYIMKELIDRNKRNRKELYFGFLDIEKAYDSINRRKLTALLQHIGICEKIINIIKSMYTNNKMKFKLGNVETEWIENNTGVRQGCIMSPTLFNLYIEELSVRIRKAKIGVQIGNRKLGCLGYADDIVLLSESKEDMDRLLDITDEYGREWGVRFSSRKCKVVEFNTTEAGQWVLGNNVLEVVENYTYLGMEISKEGIGGSTQRKINESKARKIMGMIICAGSREINKYEHGRCLWKGMAVPHCLYGTEITNYRGEDLRRLEVIQNSVGRWCLGAPKSTATEALRGEMGWSSFQERIEKGKLCFKNKIQEMNEEMGQPNI